MWTKIQRADSPLDRVEKPAPRILDTWTKIAGAVASTL
jgi:hypothetical protein